MRFTVEPPPGESAFDQWKDAMKAVARLPLGIPDEFRKKVRYSTNEKKKHERPKFAVIVLKLKHCGFNIQ